MHAIARSLRANPRSSALCDAQKRDRSGRREKKIRIGEVSRASFRAFARTRARRFRATRCARANRAVASFHASATNARMRIDACSRRVRDASAESPTRSSSAARKIFFAKLLTRAQHVIRFRAADTNCGRE